MTKIIIKTENAVIRQQKNTILKNVNLEIQSGEFIYIIGKVGSGKSSFLKTLYAELPLEYGKAEVAGFQLKKIKKSQIPFLRRSCGIVFQDFKLLTDRTVYANLEFVLRATGWKDKKAIINRINKVLLQVEMPDKKDKMPHELSGGEQQRIVLARALLNAPPIILADEPTGNIDPETSYRLIELLKEISKTYGTTVIIATHQYDLIEKFPGRVLRCENKTLTEDTELSVRPYAILPEAAENIEAIKAIENTPTVEEETEDYPLPPVLESDIVSPLAIHPEGFPEAFFSTTEEDTPENLEPVATPDTTEEETVSVQEIIPELPEQPADTTETYQERQETEDEIIESIEAEEQPTVQEEAFMPVKEEKNEAKEEYELIE